MVLNLLSFLYVFNMFFSVRLKKVYFANIFDFTLLAVLAYRRVSLSRRRLHRFGLAHAG